MISILKCIKRDAIKPGLTYQIIILNINTRIFDNCSDSFGFRGTMLIVGGLLMNNIPLVFLWRQASMSDKGKQQSGHNKKKDCYTERNNETQHCKAKKTIQKSKEDTTSSEKPLDISYVYTHVIFQVHEEARVYKTSEYNKVELQCPPKAIYAGIDNSNITANVISSDISTAKNDNEELAMSSCGADNEEVVIQDAQTEQSFIQGVRIVAKNIPFYFYMVGQALGFQAGASLTVFLQDIFLDAGFSVNDATLGIFLMNMFAIVGRLVPVLLFSIKRMPTFGVPLIGSGALPLSVLAVYYFKFLAVKMISVCVVGLAFGIHLGIGVMTMRFFDVRVLSTGMGVGMTATGLTFSVFGPLTGNNITCLCGKE